MESATIPTTQNTQWFIYVSHTKQTFRLCVKCLFYSMPHGVAHTSAHMHVLTFIHLTDAFIQSDLQKRNKSNSSKDQQ